MNNKLTTFYLVRHGETQANIDNIIQGHTNSPLTKKGILAIKELAQSLKTIKFDMAYSSDILRAKKTAEIIALEHKLTIETTKLLREKFFGEYEGVTGKEWENKVKKIWVKLTDEQKYVYTIHGIETDKDMVERLINFLREAAIANPGKKILIVTHGTVIRIFLIKLGMGTYNSLRHGTIKNGAYIVVESDGVDFFVKDMKGVNPINES